jgi:hypothetical protein
MTALSPQEEALIADSRRKRPQGYACDDGIVRCGPCVREIMGTPEGVARIAPIEKYTPLLGDGDDWCSECDMDIKAKES